SAALPLNIRLPPPAGSPSTDASTSTASSSLPSISTSSATPCSSMTTSRLIPYTWYISSLVATFLIITIVSLSPFHACASPVSRSREGRSRLSLPFACQHNRLSIPFTCRQH